MMTTDGAHDLPRYRVGQHYKIHVYCDNRPVATFHDAEEAAFFVRAANASSEAPKDPQPLDQEAWAYSPRRVINEALERHVPINRLLGGGECSCGWSFPEVHDRRGLQVGLNAEDAWRDHVTSDIIRGLKDLLRI